MKKFFFKLTLFLVLFCIIDMSCRYVFSYMAAHAVGGDNARNNYICYQTTEDVLIFGSSRAIHHYNPIIIQDSLNMSCYNCGQDGNGIILSYGRLQLINKRYNPRLIIYDVTEEFDLQKGDNQKYLGWLKAYYNNDDISDLFGAVDESEKWKMQSGMYQFNSKFLQIISDCIHPMQSMGIKGFRPLDGQIDRKKEQPLEKTQASENIDNLKLYYLDKLAEEYSSNQLVFVISPSWNEKENTYLSSLQSICKKNGINLIDYSKDNNFLHHDTYFSDASHLNTFGADTFSCDIASKIKKIIAHSPQKIEQQSMNGRQFSR